MKQNELNIIETLKDGYWDRTVLLAQEDGSPERVRKSSKPGHPSPWGVDALANEIAYLEGLSGIEQKLFPIVLRSWKEQGIDQTWNLGYEMEYCRDQSTVSSELLAGKLTQGHATEIQEQIAEALFGTIHTQQEDAGWPHNILESLQEIITQLEALSDFTSLVSSQEVIINNESFTGLAHSLESIRQSELMEKLGLGPVVRLHGDLILENILVPEDFSRITFIDPVSVAGLWIGHPLFDLVKYESYATGQLYAQRSELVRVEHLGTHHRPEFIHQILYGDPAMRPFLDIDLCRRFRAKYMQKYGSFDRAHYHLLDGYFSLVMAMNTEGTQQWSRVLHGLWSLHRCIVPQR